MRPETLDQLLLSTRELVRAIAERRRSELDTIRQLKGGAVRARLRLRPPSPPPPGRFKARSAALLSFTAQGPLFLFAALLPRQIPEPPQPPHLIVTEAEAAQAPMVPIVQRTNCPLGSRCSPFWIESFPFEHRGSTRASNERHFSSYACAPEIAEEGAEVWFEFEIEERSHLVAQIVEVPEDGVDVDLHLLTSEEEPSCLHRADGVIDANVDPGLYLLVLDTCSEQGFEQPGPFHLKIERQSPK